MATGVVIGSILLARDQLLWVEQLSVRASSHLIHHRGLKVYENGSGNVLSRACFAEEGVERVITCANGFVRRHLTIGLNSVLQAVQFPASIAHLHTGLTEMDRETFALKERKK